MKEITWRLVRSHGIHSAIYGVIFSHVFPSKGKKILYEAAVEYWHEVYLMQMGKAARHHCNNKSHCSMGLNFTFIVYLQTFTV